MDRFSKLFFFPESCVHVECLEIVSFARGLFQSLLWTSKLTTTIAKGPGDEREGCGQRHHDNENRSTDNSDANSRTDDDSFDMCVVHQAGNYVTYNGGPPHSAGHQPVYLKSHPRRQHQRDYIAARESPLGSSSR